MYPTYNTTHTGEDTQSNTKNCNFMPSEQFMQGPPRSSKKKCMTRREGIIRNMVYQRSYIHDTFRPWAKGKSMVENPINTECTEDMPEYIQSDFFWSVFRFLYAIQPESDQKNTDKNWLYVWEKRNHLFSPSTVYEKHFSNKREQFAINFLEVFKHREY